jgi:hypothetical protein
MYCLSSFERTEGKVLNVYVIKERQLNSLRTYVTALRPRIFPSNTQIIMINLLDWNVAR